MKKTNRQIVPVHDHEEKRLTYQAMIQRYKSAAEHEFYLEAILIDYACLEDRLRYMLYYLGLIADERDHKIISPQCKRVQTFRDILHRYVDPKENMNIGSISGKSKIVRGVFLRSLDECAPDEDRKFEALLCKKLNDRDRAKDIAALLDRINKWCGYRNEVIHSLMNKNLESLYAGLAEKAAEGHELFRKLDNYVSWVKRKKIREAMKL